MADACSNCGEKITDGGFLSGPNPRLSDGSLRIINFVNGTEAEEMCNKCGSGASANAAYAIDNERDRIKSGLRKVALDFPMMTIGALPGSADFRVLGMVTANVTVGTGLFNEFSQGFSDFVGAVNTQSGMASKVNKGEAAARQLLVQRAMQLGANSIIGVDVDYGVTNNNAATVNMQGTAVRIANLSAVLGEEACKAAEWLGWAWGRLNKLDRWALGDIHEGEVWAAS